MLSLAALHEPHHPPPPGDRAGHPVDRCVDHRHVHPGPEAVGQPDCRSHHRAVVGLVHVPFIQGKAIHPLPLSREPVRQPRPSDVDDVRGCNPDESHQRGDRHDAAGGGSLMVDCQASGTRDGRRKEAGDRGIPDRDGQKRQDDERDRHRSRGFMQVPGVLRIHPRLAPKGHEHEAKAVERRERRRHQGDCGERFAQRAGRPGLNHDLVLAKKAGGEGESCQSQGADHEGPVGHRQLVLESPHLPHVLLVVERDDHRPASQKQEGLERAVGEQMEDPGRVGAQPAGHHHESELADGGPGHHALDVILRQRDRGPEEHRGGAGHRDHVHRRRRQVVERRHPRHHEHAGGHHGSGVNQRRDRRGTFHGVRQPHMERHLRRFAHRSQEQQQADHGQRRDLPPAPDGTQEIDGFPGEIGGLGKNMAIFQRPEGQPHQQHPQQKPEISHPIDDEGLGRRSAGRCALIPMADQEVGAQPDRLPEDEQLQEVVGHHQHEHRKSEQGDVGEEPGIAALAVHVADRIDVHEPADDRHQQ